MDQNNGSPQADLGINPRREGKSDDFRDQGEGGDGTGEHLAHGATEPFLTNGGH